MSGQTGCLLPCCLEALLWFPSFAVVGRKHNCCLFIAVNNIQILNGTNLCIPYQVLATALDVPDPQEVLAWLTALWSHTFAKASKDVPAQQSRQLHSADSGMLAALLIRCDSDIVSRRAALAAPWNSPTYLNLYGFAQIPLQTSLTRLWVKVTTYMDSQRFMNQFWCSPGKMDIPDLQLKEWYQRKT